jgi:hypothetical protein
MCQILSLRSGTLLLALYVISCLGLEGMSISKAAIPAARFCRPLHSFQEKDFKSQQILDHRLPKFARLSETL